MIETMGLVIPRELALIPALLAAAYYGIKAWELLVQKASEPRKILDRRYAPRHEAEIPVLIENNGVPSRARSMDISATGIRLKSERLFPVGEPIKIRLHPHRSHEIEARAEVLRHIPNSSKDWRDPIDGHRIVARFVNPAVVDLDKLLP